MRQVIVGRALSGCSCPCRRKPWGRPSSLLKKCGTGFQPVFAPAGSRCHTRFHQLKTGATRQVCILQQAGKGFDGLSGIVRGAFGADPLDGSLYLFVNRRRDRIKILHFDGSGYWLYYKLLEAGTFEVIASEGQCVQIDSTQLAMLLGGVSLVGARRRKRYQRAS